MGIMKMAGSGAYKFRSGAYKFITEWLERGMHKDDHSFMNILHWKVYESGFFKKTRKIMVIGSEKYGVYKEISDYETGKELKRKNITKKWVFNLDATPADLERM